MCKLTPYELKLIGELCEILEPFEEATDKCQGHPLPIPSLRSSGLYPLPIPSSRDSGLHPLPIPSSRDSGLYPVPIPSSRDSGLHPLPIPSSRDSGFESVTYSILEGFRFASATYSILEGFRFASATYSILEGFRFASATYSILEGFRFASVTYSILEGFRFASATYSILEGFRFASATYSILEGFRFASATYSILEGFRFASATYSILEGFRFHFTTNPPKPSSDNADIKAVFGCSDNAEFLWRLARASRDLALLSSTSAEDKKRLMYEAFDYSRNALEKNESSSAAHKWYAICISDIGDYEGTKIKIGNAYVVKEHLQRAIELNPKDATAIHILGLWCFAFAELPWYQRKIAAILFASPPSSTYEEALGYFLKAEEVDANFYSKNLLMLGKSYMMLKDQKSSLLWLSKAKDYPAHTEEDKQIHKEAVELLKTLGG
ncbi:UNVERIFIED_CONTAM: hypothetical protein FKN15_002658 [Acipenser sinensis]